MQGGSSIKQQNLTLTFLSIFVGTMSGTALAHGAEEHCAVVIASVEVGDYVPNPTEIAVVQDRSQITVDFCLPESLVGMLRLGQKVTATSLALSELQFNDQISAIGSRAQVDSPTITISTS